MFNFKKDLMQTVLGIMLIVVSITMSFKKNRPEARTLKTIKTITNEETLLHHLVFVVHYFIAIAFLLAGIALIITAIF